MVDFANLPLGTRASLSTFSFSSPRTLLQHRADVKQLRWRILSPLLPPRRTLPQEVLVLIFRLALELPPTVPSDPSDELVIAINGRSPDLTLERARTMDRSSFRAVCSSWLTAADSPSCWEDLTIGDQLASFSDPPLPYSTLCTSLPDANRLWERVAASFYRRGGPRRLDTEQLSVASLPAVLAVMNGRTRRLRHWSVALPLGATFSLLWDVLSADDCNLQSLGVIGRGERSSAWSLTRDNCVTPHTLPHLTHLHLHNIRVDLNRLSLDLPHLVDLILKRCRPPIKNRRTAQARRPRAVHFPRLVSLLLDYRMNSFPSDGTLPVRFDLPSLSTLILNAGKYPYQSWEVVTPFLPTVRRVIVVACSVRFQDELINLLTHMHVVQDLTLPLANRAVLQALATGSCPHLRRLRLVRFGKEDIAASAVPSMLLARIDASVPTSSPSPLLVSPIEELNVLGPRRLYPFSPRQDSLLRLRLHTLTPYIG